MNILILLQVALVCFACLLALLTILSAGAKWRKSLALLLFLAIAGTGYTAYVQLLGLPKPVEFSALPNNEDASTIVANHMVEDVAIYLWITDKESGQPIAYALPWSTNTARKLQEAQQQAEASGQKVQVKKQKKDGARPDDSTEWVFDVTAPPPLPPKQI